jgi:hypothetical protein
VQAVSANTNPAATTPGAINLITSFPLKRASETPANLPEARKTHHAHL